MKTEPQLTETLKRDITLLKGFPNFPKLTDSWMGIWQRLREELQCMLG